MRSRGTSIGLLIRLCRLRGDAWKWQMLCRKPLQFELQVVRVHQACWIISTLGGADGYLGRLPYWHLIRAESSRLWMYAFVDRQQKNKDVTTYIDPIANIRNDSIFFFNVDFKNCEWFYLIAWEDTSRSCTRKNARRKLSHSQKMDKSSKEVGKNNDGKPTLLFDSCAVVSIIDTTFARTIVCDWRKETQECLQIWENAYINMGQRKEKD